MHSDSSLPIPGIVCRIALLAIGLRISVAWAAHFTSEDFLITLRYAENLAHGNALVYNLHERVLGTTTPLYTLYLALLSWLGLPAAWGGKLINILADGGLCVLCYRLLQQAGEERAGRLAAFLVAVSPLHIQWAVSGMETSLVTCCSMAVWVAFVERRNQRAYIAAAVLFLLRWDGILVFGILTLAACLRDRRMPFRELLLFTLIVAPWLLWASRFYGNPIPVTAFAKATVYGWRAQHDPVWLRRAFPALPKLMQRFVFNPGYGLLTLLAFVGAKRSWNKRHWVLGVPLGWFCLYWLAFLFSRVLLFPWYLVPPLPIYEAFAALGVIAVGEWGQARFTLKMQPTAARLLLASGLAALMLAGVATAGMVASGEQDVEVRVRIPLARWLKAHSRPDEQIMLEPIGYIGYYSERPILDVVGLVTPRVLPFYQRESLSPLLDMARAFKPEWCVLRPGELDHIRKAAAAQGSSWEAEYELVKTFSYAPGSNVYYVFRRKQR